MIKAAKRPNADGRYDECEYIRLECPLGCGCVVEVLSKNRTRHQSVCGRAHFRKCTKLAEEQRAAFNPKKKKKKEKDSKKKNRKLPKAPVWKEGQSVEDYIDSFKFKPKKHD